MTTLKAVKLAPENFDLILQEPTNNPPTEAELERWYRYAQSENRVYYYLPRYIPRQETWSVIWQLFVPEVLDFCFDYDKDLIDTQFVEITRK